MKVFCYHGNKSTILLFDSIFRTTHEVSGKLYFMEISEVSEKLWLFNHRRADFLASKSWNIFSLLTLFKRTIKELSQLDNKKPEELESQFDHFGLDNSYPSSPFKGPDIVDLDFMFTNNYLMGIKLAKPHYP